ncbi:MAG: tRNA epoxyqueuosine(34) reductase QueG [Planctomycetes bacterium]|nr:tRNA epoxyqueuosine(34) reductase QueG [Planctomycetota bacterium]MCC7170980.1 tRNA epoxyqueuosine(34) reductase QueG [Planctomycetota bacterium]
MIGDLRELLRTTALEAGFARVGFCALDALSEHAARWRTWIDAGLHASMRYLERHGALRERPEQWFPGARSALVVGAVYAPSTSTSVAAYAQREDYHRVLATRLDGVLDAVRARGHALTGVVAVDTKPVLERALAERAGLGWIGKNTMLLDEEHGPWLMLGVLVLDAALEPDAPAKHRCGTCIRCLDACPTAAFVAPYVLDARRCLSYWSIEHRGAWPDAMRVAFGTRVFGCDDCLTACPFGPPRTIQGEPILALVPELQELPALEVLRRCEQGFGRHFKHHAIARAGKAGLLRNAVTALGNGPDAPAARDALRYYLDHTAAEVRAHSAWSLARIGEAHDTARIEAAAAREADPDTKADLQRSLAVARTRRFGADS